jgi:hypothetical protein
MKEGRVDRRNCFHLHDSVSMFLVVKSELVTFQMVFYNHSGFNRESQS